MAYCYFLADHHGADDNAACDQDDGGDFKAPRVVVIQSCPDANIVCQKDLVKERI